jgi:hypothetical protein
MVCMCEHALPHFFHAFLQSESSSSLVRMGNLLPKLNSLLVRIEMKCSGALVVV